MVSLAEESSPERYWRAVQRVPWDVVFSCPPDFLPELRFWAGALHADTVQLRVGAQYVRQSRHNRARVRTPDGTQWLTIPVKRGQFKRSIKETGISPDGDWWRHHTKALRYNYGATPFYEHLMPDLLPYLTPDHEMLSEVTVPLIRVFAKWLGCEAAILECARPADHELPGGATQSPVGAAAKPARFGLFDEGREVVVESVIPEYRQAFEGHIGGLSVVDLLFNHGPDARDIILSKTTYAVS